MSSDDLASDPSLDRAAAPDAEPAVARSPRARSPLDAIFADPLLTRLILAVLRSKGIPEQDRKDMKQEVLTSLYEWCSKDGAREMPAEIKRVGRTIARNHALKYWRRVAVDGKHNAGLVGETEELGQLAKPSAVDLLDLKKIVAEIEELVANGSLSEKAAATLIALTEDVTYADHANETDQNAATVRKTHERSKNKIVARLQARGLTDVGLSRLLRAGTAIAIAILIAVLVFRGHLNGVPEAPIAENPETLVPPTLEELTKVLAPPVDHSDEAARALLRAEVDYKNYEWDGCVRKSAQAKTLDPRVGDSPELRNGCLNEKQVDMEAKTPRRPRKKE